MTTESFEFDYGRLADEMLRRQMSAGGEAAELPAVHDYLTLNGLLGRVGRDVPPVAGATRLLGVWHADDDDDGRTDHDQVQFVGLDGAPNDVVGAVVEAPPRAGHGDGDRVVEHCDVDVCYDSDRRKQRGFFLTEIAPDRWIDQFSLVDTTGRRRAIGGRIPPVQNGD